LYCIQDATIACTYAMLAATALGLSTVWVGAFDEKIVWEGLGITCKLDVSAGYFAIKIDIGLLDDGHIF
jgi:nitroreductase